MVAGNMDSNDLQRRVQEFAYRHSLAIAEQLGSGIGAAILPRRTVTA
jgi:hypothetical protein